MFKRSTGNTSFLDVPGTPSSSMRGRRWSSVHVESKSKSGKDTTNLEVMKDSACSSDQFHAFIDTKKNLKPKIGWLVEMLEQMEEHRRQSDDRAFMFSTTTKRWIGVMKNLGHDGKFEYSKRLESPQETEDDSVVGLETVLDTPEYFKTLEAFVMDNGFDQVLDFLEDVRDFRRITHESTKVSAAKSIYERHIARDSIRAVPLRLSLVRAVRQRIELEQVDDCIFDEAYQIVFQRLAYGDFRRFVRSNMFMEMLPEELAVKVVAKEHAKHSSWVNEKGYLSLHVDVISAVGLSAKDGTKPDPFVTVSVASKTFKSRSDKHTQNPNFEQKFQIPVSKTSLFAKVCVWSKDILGTKSFLGHVVMYMSDIEEPFLPKWYPLMEDPLIESEPVTGEIQLCFTFSRDPAKEDKDALYVDKDGLGANSVAELVRGKVSKKKIRFLEDGYNLDLTYVTDNVIAMGFPSEKIEGFYRNNMKDVQKLLNTRHPRHYKVYNLCSERTYSEDKFDAVAHYGFDDHNPCPFNLLLPICEDIHTFIQSSPQNVVSVHCKAGKGRTGLVVASYLLLAKEKKSAQEALEFFAERRTLNRKGVTIPSQIRWVHYFERFLKENVPKQRMLQLHAITIVDPMPLKASNVLFKIYQPGLLLFDSKYMKRLKISSVTENELPALRIEFPEETPLPLFEDVKFVFSMGSILRRTEKLFHFWLNTRFMDGDALELSKNEIDKAVKDKKHKLYSKHLRIRIEYEDLEEAELTDDSSVRKQMLYLIGLPNKAFEFLEEKKKRRESLSWKSVDSSHPEEKSNTNLTALPEDQEDQTVSSSK